MSLLKRLSVLVAVLAASLMAPTLASANSAIVGAGAVTVTGVPGTGQSLTIAGNASSVTFTGADLTASGTCSGTNPVTCTGVSGITIDAAGSGPGANFVSATGLDAAVAITFNGSAGNDTFLGGPAGDTLNGNAGDDVLAGGGGGDTINGGDDGDHLIGEGASDVVNGDNGDDMVGVENLGDADTFSCGAGNDIVGLDLDFGGNSLELTPIGSSGCERQLPHIRGDATLAAVPQAGVVYAGTNVIPAGRFGAAPDTSVLKWYVCSGPVLTATSTNFDGAAVNPSCTQLVGTGSSVKVPSTSVGKYLGAVGKLGLLTSAGDLSQAFATESFTSAVARQITTAPVSANDFTTASKLKCKKASCSITLKNAGLGTVTIAPQGGSKKLAKKVTKKISTSTARVAIKLSSAGKKKLKRTKRLSLKLKVTFAPTGGTARSQNVKVSYKLKK